ncbi:PMEI domain-containing protein [Abeliophyllum distichum]|uniref:PMEI domain-containing protein n=1 Tax=Abeliophyllum distichum TaxID=126358 RepID=A0ABD1SSP8_9LAMI
MVSSFISSILMSLFLSSLLLTPPCHADTSPELLKLACTVDQVTDPKTWNYTLCIKVLESNPKVASSPNLPTLAINIIELGISNVTNTQKYIQKTLTSKNIESSLRIALKACDQSYDLILKSFQSAFGEVKDDEDYESASYDLSLARTDYLNSCQQALASNKVEDLSISTGSKFVILFSAAADAVCTRLDV